MACWNRFWECCDSNNSSPTVGVHNMRRYEFAGRDKYSNMRGVKKVSYYENTYMPHLLFWL